MAPSSDHPAIDGGARAGHRYAAFYCEENVWHLAADPTVGAGARFVVFISNALRQCPMAQQRAIPQGQRFVAWDYHVVLVVVDDARAAHVWDLDTRLALPVRLDEYVAKSFPDGVPAALAPRFRVIPAEEFRATFASDRSHMRTRSGRWRVPPPPWAPLRTESEVMNLDRFIDVVADGPGALLDREALLSRFAE